jgi:hypothetical protein
VGLRGLSLADLWAAWSVYWTIVLGLVLVKEGPSDLRNQMGSLGLGAGAGGFLGAVFAGGMWLLMRAIYGF